jgi:biofilm PGA synthesis N-glycosyltransferase PgaC
MNFIPLTFFSFSFLAISVYAVIVLIALRGIKKLKNDEPLSSGRTFIDLIIPYHNELPNLPQLLKSLEKQSFDNYRIIWVNDHSTDGSEKFLHENNSRDNSIFINSKLKGKKAAIQKAIQQSTAELIVFTDADCQHSPDWLTYYASAFETKGSGLYFGSVTYQTTTYMQRIFGLEFLSLVGTGMGLAAAGKPVYMNGANYAISKDLLEAHKTKDGDNFASGDDVFLLHQVKKQYGASKIYPLVSSKAEVRTPAPQNMKSFINQRVRWGGKSRGYTDIFSKLLAIIVFLTAITQLTSLLFIDFIWLTAILWFVKIIIDSIALSSYRRVWEIAFPLWGLLILCVVYPSYIFITGIIGFFSNKNHW